MKEIKCYQCEICYQVHRTREKAQKCESIGKESPLVSVGDILIYKYNVSGFDCETEVRISKIIDKGHFIIYKFQTRFKNGWINGLYGKKEIFGNREFLERIKQNKCLVVLS